MENLQWSSSTRIRLRNAIMRPNPDMWVEGGYEEPFVKKGDSGRHLKNMKI